MKVQAIRRSGTDDDPVFELVEGELCASKDHVPMLATKRAHMVQGPTLYCERCAEMAKRIYDVLGTHLYIEDVALTVLKTSAVVKVTDERQIDV